MKIGQLLTSAAILMSSSASAVQLTTANFASEASGKALLVKFYAPMCGGCKALAPAWKQLTSEYEGNGLIAEVDCTAAGNRILCQDNGVETYPAIMWGFLGELEHYNGGKSFEELKAFADANLNEVPSFTSFSFLPKTSLPPLNVVSVVVTALQLLLTCSQYFLESSDNKQTPYSKFFDSKKSAVLLVSGRVGMLFIYCPAMLFSAYVTSQLAGPSPSLSSQRDLLVSFLLFLHFFKRVLEVVFLHKYSNKMDIMTGAPIGIYYTFVCWIVTYFQKFVPAEQHTSENLAWGVSIFAIGQFGNLYHHWLLASLRPDALKAKVEDTASKYKVPKAGLFRLVTMPHYTFELVSWVGVAVAAGHLNSVLVVTSMTSYLGGRAVATRNWYRKNLKEFPKERKAIIPFLF